MEITFKQFNKDFREYYNVKDSYTIRTHSDMEEVIYDLYNTDDFDINYDKNIIELF